ncbi:hypothetical protein OG497_37590 [Streptomyces sp. NBC_01242]|uniref:hypothetical protein n=1 Tax=Streptomyces sp. NBC_01242 TaxID=2903795 RepID=UPI0022521421|nr:hypothetical protein [Streptomyces sp. NBC_01242]MCX4799571.1 hypothetical protein [Streptomyces sp. NBC_01242]
MIRVRAANAHIKRTFRPTYAWTQATPKSVFLDPAWDRSVPIYPGMVLMRKGGELVSLIDATGLPYGFAADYVGGDGFDPLLDVGMNATAVWVFGNDAEAEILAPAFDTAVTWTDPTNGTETLVHAQTTGANRGKLVPAGTAGASTVAVARLLKVNSPSKITIGGLR